MQGMRSRFNPSFTNRFGWLAPMLRSDGRLFGRYHLVIGFQLVQKALPGKSKFCPNNQPNTRTSFIDFAARLKPYLSKLKALSRSATRSFPTAWAGDFAAISSCAGAATWE